MVVTFEKFFKNFLKDLHYRWDSFMNSLHISLHYFVCACVSNLTQGMIKKINQQFATGEVIFFRTHFILLSIFCPESRPSSRAVSTGLPTGQATKLTGFLSFNSPGVERRFSQIRNKILFTHFYSSTTSTYRTIIWYL